MLFFIALLAGIIFLDFIPKRKELSKPVRAVYLSFLCVATVFMVLVESKHPFPSLSSFLELGIKSLFGQ